MTRRHRMSTELLPDSLPLTRRRFMTHVAVGSAGLALGVAGVSMRATAGQPASNTPPETLLDASPYVYISPLLSSGKESSCHAELWFGWIDESVIVTVAADRWKAKALDRGLNEARIWVGDHGRWKTTFGGRNEDFRAAPNFVARAEKVDDPGMIDRLLAVYDKKYPHEIASWRDRMRAGNADGSRIMIRYRIEADRSS
jgi:hypothetical protein